MNVITKKKSLTEVRVEQVFRPNLLMFTIEEVRLKYNERWRFIQPVYIRTTKLKVNFCCL